MTCIVCKIILFTGISVLYVKAPEKAVDLFSFMYSSTNNILAILSLAQILSVAASNMNLSV